MSLYVCGAFALSVLFSVAGLPEILELHSFVDGGHGKLVIDCCGIFGTGSVENTLLELRQSYQDPATVCNTVELYIPFFVDLR